MKRIIAVALMSLVILAFPFATASSAPRKIEIPDLKMSVEIPDGWVVFTRNMRADDPNFAVFGNDKATTDKYLTDYSAYLFARKKDSSETITIVMMKDLDNVFNFNLLSITEINDFKEKLVNVLSKQYDVSLCTVYKTEQATYVSATMHGQMDNVDWYVKEYETIINGMVISLTVGADSPITPDRESLIKNVVDSVIFAEVLEKPASSANGQNQGGYTLTRALIVGGSVFVITFIYQSIKNLLKKRSSGNNGSSPDPE